MLHSGIETLSIVALQHLANIDLNTEAQASQSKERPMTFVSDFTLSHGVAHSIAALKLRFAQYRVYRRTLAELRGLSASELNDLGLNKTLLKRVAYEAAYGV